MEFISDNVYLFVIIGLLIAFIIDFKLIRPKKGLKASLQFRLYAYGIAMFVLSMAIPHVFPGYFDDLSDIDNKKMFLYHLQRQNEAIVKTTEAIRNMVFLSFIMLLPILIEIIKYLKVEKSIES